MTRTERLVVAVATVALVGSIWSCAVMAEARKKIDDAVQLLSRYYDEENDRMHVYEYTSTSGATVRVTTRIRKVNGEWETEEALLARHKARVDLSLAQFPPA